MNTLLALLSLLQNPERLAVRFAGMTAITGYEQAMTDTLLTLLPGSSRDRAGNVTLTLGRGTPQRLASCPLDEIGYVVGNVTDDGYLLLRRVGGGQRLSPLFTRNRPQGGDAPFTVDNAYVDVGATSREGVAALGLGTLSPLSLTKRPQRYGERDALLAAPVAGRRAACAALAAAALAKPRVRGTVVIAFTVQSLYAVNAGLNTVKNLQGPFDETREVTLPVKFADTAVETVALSDAAALVQDLVQWIGGRR